MAASNSNRFSFRNPFNFFISSTNNNTNSNSRPNSPRNSRPSSPISSGFWSSLYRKTSSTSTNTSSSSTMSDNTAPPTPPLSLTSSPATSPDVGYFPSITTPNDSNTNLKPITTPCSGGFSTDSLVPPAPVIKRNASTPVIHVQPPIPGRKQIRVDPLSTQFPKPAAELSVEELLARKPGRWTLTQWVEKQKVVEEERKVVTVQDDAEKKRMEMEKVKSELRALASGL